MKIVLKIRDWYGKYERPVSSLSLILGFVFDAIVLKRVDMFWENIWVIGHIVIVAICMVLVHRFESFLGDEANPNKIHFWLVNIIQFTFGGLISVFLVFYFRSSDLISSWPFIFMLIVIFWANESLKRQYIRLTFQVSLLFLSIFLCAIFLVPVIVHQIGPLIFILSGVVSLLVVYIFLYILKNLISLKFEQSKESIIISIVTIFIVMNVFYFTNIIPPIPLSLKDSGIYYTIWKNVEGNYIVTYEDIGWRKFLSLQDDFHVGFSDITYAYSAVFSPTSLNTTIVHQWQYYDQSTESWIDFSKVNLSLIGGREGGFRTFSKQIGLSLGRWRVNVLTNNGQVIGRLSFNIVSSVLHSPLSTKVLD